MLTRGYFLGEIIDEFASLSAQVALRCRLGFTDLNVISEDFFKDILNIILSTSLINLNVDRSNEPALDLGDKLNKLAFQVTSTSNVAKVHKTLKALTVEQKSDYSTIRILIIGKKKSSYSLDEKFANPIGFKVEDIWDLDDLARRSLSLPLEKLQILHAFIRKNVTRLKIELEVADEETGYCPTNGFEKWEPRHKPTLGEFKKFPNFCAERSNVNLEDIDMDGLLLAFKKLAGRLSHIPRITREFLAMMFEHREVGKTKRNQGFSSIVIEKGKRLYGGSDFDEEVALLEHAGLVYVDADDPYECGLAEVRLRLSEYEDIAYYFAAFVKKEGLSYRLVLGNIDFSAF